MTRAARVPGGYNMKKTVLFISLLFLAGCTTSYSYKASVSFDRTNLEQAPDIGISMHNSRIKGLKAVMTEDLLTFAGTPLRFHDLSSDTILTFDRQDILNCNALKNKYPNVEYVMATYEHDPKISKGSRKVQSWEERTLAGQPDYLKDKTYESSTTTKVRCEIMLFDLKKCILIAKADRDFRETVSTLRTRLFATERTWPGYLEGVLTNALDPDPKAREIPSSRATGFFFFFLKHIHDAGSFDSDYFMFRFR